MDKETLRQLIAATESVEQQAQALAASARAATQAARALAERATQTEDKR